MSKTKHIWEILIPTTDSQTGIQIDKDHHESWDNHVRSIAGGLTIHATARGHWINPKGDITIESMIPVKILATKKDIEKIIDFTLKHYEQEAVLAYKISGEYILKGNLDGDKTSSED